MDNSKLFQFPWVASQTLCRNCNVVMPISAMVAKELINNMGQIGAFPEISIVNEEDYKKYYFIVGFCANCMFSLLPNERVAKFHIEIKKVE